MKKLAGYKMEIILGILLFIVGINFAPTDGVDSNHYNTLKEQNTNNIKVLEEKETELTSLNPKIKEVQNEIDNISKELEAKKQVQAN